jgi:thymidylate synthase
MHLHVRNVNDGFKTLVKFFDDGANNRTETFHRGINPIVRRPSRNGDVLMIAEPVTITYSHPLERILFNEARDCNPYSLLYEALWMLAGRNDVEPLAYYTKQFREYSDDGKVLNGAYGYRWRKAGRVSHNIGVSSLGLDVDQLDIIAAHLKADPNSRRAVLQMWNVTDDLLKIGVDSYPCCEAVRRLERVPGDATTLYGGECPEHGRTYYEKASRDVCCNLSVMFVVRTERVIVPSYPDKIPPDWTDGKKYLDITVINRSNDLIWGALGANYCTFSVLQEYMAARLGVEVGLYHHFTNNLHVYTGGGNTAKWEPEKWLGYYDGMEVEYTAGMNSTRVPLVKDPKMFEKELPKFVEKYSGKTSTGTNGDMWSEPFLKNVADPMMMAFQSWKGRGENVEWFSVAMEWVDSIKADDWRIAARNWLQRRKAKVQANG